MAASQAYRDFQDTLHMVEALLKLERRYPDPAPTKSQNKVEGLRGGAMVLMVAAFENFLKELVEEYLDEFTTLPLKFDPNKLPDIVRLHNMLQIIERAEKNGHSQKRSIKIAQYMSAAQNIIDQRMVVTSFSQLARSNPNPRRVKELFGSLGVEDFFRKIKPSFEKQWGRVATTFIQDTLQSVIDKRHDVAHTANVLTLTRKDLETYLRFLRVLASVCDTYLKNHLTKVFIP